MLQHMKLDHKFWAEIVATVTYIHNWILTKAIFNMILEEVCCEYTPSINHLCVFGCVACVHVPKEARTKLDSKGVKCIFISYCEETKGYKLYNSINQYVFMNMMLFLMNPKTLLGKHWFQNYWNIWFQIKTQRWRMKEFFNMCKKIQQWLKKRWIFHVFFFVDVNEPHSFMEALNGEDLQHWIKAMDFEF